MWLRLTSLLLVAFTASSDLTFALSLKQMEERQQGHNVKLLTAEFDESDEDAPESESQPNDVDFGTVPPMPAVVHQSTRTVQDARSGSETTRTIDRRAQVHFTSVVGNERGTQRRDGREDWVVPMSIVAKPVRTHAPPLFL